MNETMMNRSRERWMKENEKTPGKKTFKDLSPKMQELIYFTSRENESYYALQAAQLEKAHLYQIGLKADTYDFSDINARIVDLENDYHNYRAKVSRLRKHLEDIS